MAVIPFTIPTFNGEGYLYKVTGLTTGDESSVLTFVSLQVDITVQLYGTIGGATVTVQGTTAGVFGVCDDAYGSAMSYTAISATPKPIGPALTGVKIVVAGGAGVSVDGDVYVVNKVR